MAFNNGGVAALAAAQGTGTGIFSPLMQLVCLCVRRNTPSSATLSNSRHPSRSRVFKSTHNQAEKWDVSERQR
jgi:hypothetical protein